MPTIPLPTLRCRCGHGRDAHRHYRSGTDCALCDCLKWRLALPLPGRGDERDGPAAG